MNGIPIYLTDKERFLIRNALLKRANKHLDIYDKRAEEGFKVITETSPTSKELDLLLIRYTINV